MNGLNNSSDEVVECPLCMEPLEVDDLNFFPCTCGYQICRFCWHRIRTDENELCPACRKEYPENPADFTPLTQEEMIAFKSQKRQRDQQRKQKITENRKHLANVRVVQKNLVFVVGLPPRLADADILKKHEYFGKYGKIHKVVINPSTTYAGIQGPSASAYVTYVHNSDALRAIQSVNNIMIDGRLIKTSLGTTKYCSHFMKNQQCPKNDCMYLHELGDSEASFTKEEMHQGKHQEYEKRLHDALIAASGISSTGGIGQTSSNGNSTISVSGTTTAGPFSKNSDSKAMNCNASSSSSSVSSTTSLSMSSSLSSTSSSSSSTTNGAVPVATVSAGTQQKDAWPSLSVSPVNNKELVALNKNKKERSKHDKAKNDKSAKGKNKNNNNHGTNNNNNYNLINSNSQQHLHISGIKEKLALTDITATHISEQSHNSSSNNNINNKMKIEKREKTERPANRHKDHTQVQQQQKQKRVISADEEIKLIEDCEHQNHCDGKNNRRHNSSDSALKNEKQRSSSSNSNASSSSTSSDSTSALSETSTSGKSSPGNFSEPTSSAENSTELTKNGKHSPIEFDSPNNENCTDYSNSEQNLAADTSNSTNNDNVDVLSTVNNIHNIKDNVANVHNNERSSVLSNTADLHLQNGSCTHSVIDTTATLSKLNIFDDNNSFFSSSSSASLQQSLLLKNKVAAELRQNQINSAITSQLPDLLNGIDGFQNNTTSTNDWEEAFKNVITRNSKPIDEQFQQQQTQQQEILQHQQQQQQQQHQQLLQHEEFLRIQELQKRSSLLNNIGLSQINGPHNDFPNTANNFQNSSDLSRLSQMATMQHQQQQQQLLQQQASHISDHVMGNSGLFGTSMSKFFDFHKNQQQQLHQQFQINGHAGTGSSGSDQLRMASMLENNRVNSQFLDQPNGLLSTQQQLQKQRLHGKFDPLVTQQPQNQQQSQQTQPQVSQARIPNQFTQNPSADDDLGFDPFIETQKALAELMENEVVQQQTTNVVNNSSGPQTVGNKIMQHQQQHQMLDNMQRARMPPPGFNHMNAFGFGVPRVQNNSKILPFVNMTANGAVSNGQSMQQQQQQMQMANNWNIHMANFQHTQQVGDTSMPIHQMNPNQNNGIHSKGYSNTDWTAMDPAILSFRQFSSFSQQQQQMPHHHQQQDMFMQHLAQQQQQNGQGFGSQSQLHGNINLPNNALMNPQQALQPQPNFSHSNWLSTEQNMFMNSLTNNFANNNFDKFSIPMPPGIHLNNLNKQQKTECIN